MSFAFILFIAIALAMDAFAVALGISVRSNEIKITQVLRLSFFFGFFQFMMSVLGWLVGQGISPLIEPFDHWVAFFLLVLIGMKMSYESFLRTRPDEKQGLDPLRCFMLITLSVATSIDAFAVGMGLSALDVSIFYPAALIGAVAFILTAVGAKMGILLGRWIGRKAELLGGAILIGIGIKILVEHV